MHKIAVKRPDTSALGQKRTFAPQKVMSALTPKVRSATAHVCYGPKATFCFSLDNHISPLEEGLRNCQTKRPGRLEIDDKFKFGRLLNWHVRRQSTLQYFGYNRALCRNEVELSALYGSKPPASAKDRGLVAAAYLTARSATFFDAKLPWSTTAPAPSFSMFSNAASISRVPRTIAEGAMSIPVLLPVS